MAVRVQEADFSLADEIAKLTKGRTDMGALVTFTGLVRDTDGTLQAMELEHYPAMTEAALEEIENQTITRWSLSASLIIHRYGNMKPGDQIMMVATAAPHRADAFEAAEYLMDYLKSRAPFWKKEHLKNGQAEWVSAKDEDETALDRWSN